MPIPEPVSKLFEEGRLAHVVTINRDGSPQVTLVWAGIDRDEIVIGHLADHRKLKNIRRDPRVSLSVETDRMNAQRLIEYLVVHGTARVEEGGGADLLQRLAYTHIGPDVGEFPPMDHPPAGYVTRITPLRYGGIGSWVGS